METIIVAVLLGLVLLRWGLLLGGALLLVARVEGCPACFERTLPVRKVWLRRLVPFLRWHWCPACGWQGPGRRGANELVPDVGARRAPTPTPSERG